MKRAQRLFPIIGIPFAVIVNAAWICLSWVSVAALDGTFSRVNALKLVRLRADPGKGAPFLERLALICHSRCTAVSWNAGTKKAVFPCVHPDGDC